MKRHSLLALLLPLLLPSCTTSSPSPKILLPTLYENQYYLVDHDFRSDGTFRIPVRSDGDLTLDNFRTINAYQGEEILTLTPTQLERCQDNDYLLTVESSEPDVAIDRIDLHMSNGDSYSLPVYVLLRSSTETLSFWSEGIELLASDIYGEKFEVTYHFQPSVETTLDFLRMPSFSFSPLTEPKEIHIQEGNEGHSLTDLTYTFQANVEYEIVVSFPENFNAYFFTDALSLYGRAGNAEETFFAESSADCLKKEFDYVFDR